MRPSRYGNPTMDPTNPLQPKRDVYLAIFTLVAESTEEGMLKLRIASIAVSGVHR